MGTRFLPSEVSAQRTARRLLGAGGASRLEHEQARRRVPWQAALAPAAPPDPEDRTTSGLPPLPPLTEIALHRLGFGPGPGDRAAYEALGANDTTRLQAYLDQQLAPAAINDSSCDALLAANYSTLAKSYAQLWQEHALDDQSYENYILPYTETELMACMRPLWSKRQLHELMVRHWHDHFNVLGQDAGPMFLSYDRDVMRVHALGNFRALLEAVAKHLCMLEYLDNKYNTYNEGLPNNGINENYARELLELHTLGAEHYYGSTPASSVPRDGQGRPLGYCDEDVTNAARCLTGWTTNDQPWYEELGNDGTFAYVHDWHDRVNDKTVLGVTLTDKNTPLADGHGLLDVLVNHPACHRFIARKLCRRLIADDPPEVVVQQAAATFAANAGAADQIARTVRTIVLANEFRTTWGQKVKRPFEAIIGAMRAGGGTFPFRNDELHSGLLWWIYLTGNLPFHWAPPNGYPDRKEPWISSSPRVITWNICTYVADPYDWTEGGTSYYLDLLAQTPSNLRSANQLVGFWVPRILGNTMPQADRDRLVAFMADGADPNAALDFSVEWEAPARLRSMVALIFQSPSFLWR